MFQIAFIILLMFEFYSVGIGLPSTNSPPLPSPTLITAPITTLSSISTPIPMPHSNGTIAASAPATTKPTSSTLMIAPPGYTMASSPPNSASELQNQSRWSPSDVGTVVFGCIGSILGILTLWLTFWLGRQRFKLIIKEDFREELQLKNLP